MKFSLPGLTQRKEIGLSIGERTVAVSQVAMTLFGPLEIAKDQIEYEGVATLGAALETLLNRNFSKRELETSKFNVALPALRLFFSTRPIQAENRETSADVLLHEVLQSATINVDDMAVDLIRNRPGSRPLASIVACRKKYLAGVLAALESCKIKPSRVEPAPCALIRQAVRKLKAPRKTNAYIRVFLGEGRALAVLLAGPDLPLLWRPFPLCDKAEASSIASTVASLQMLSPYCGLETPIGAVLVHGRPELTELLGSLQSAAPESLRYLRADGPSLAETEEAKGVATSLNLQAASFNLVRSIVAPPSIRESFPWGQVAMQSAALILVTWLLQTRLIQHRAEAGAVIAHTDKYPWATKLSIDKLKAEKKELEQRVEAVHNFLDSRVCWTAYSRDVTNLLSDDLALTAFHGSFELEAGGKSSIKPKKLLILRLVAPIPRTGAMPKEIDEFLQSLRTASSLKTSFPSIELSELTWSTTPSKKANANFSVTCLPKKADTAKPGAAKAKGKS